MSNPAFIVDGFTEKLIINRICPGKPVRRTDLNGKSVTIQAIANKVHSLIRLLGNRHYPIVIVIDREQRKEDCKTISATLLAELKTKGLSDQDIRVSVADRMLENWIIADWDCLNVNKSKPNSIEGSRGAGIIKSTLGQYNKTTDGVDLFLKANPSVIYEQSESFRQFADGLTGINCNYLERIETT